MTAQNIDSHEQPEYLAALDLGSNSFHFVLARMIDDQLQVLHSEKYRVRLADGLDENNMLSDEAIERGIHVLDKLTTSTQHLDKAYLRAVATFTLRQAKNASAFLNAAAKVCPFNIEIISGHEEARLIYQGVAHNRQYNEQQLIIDIGGGSTECIIGQQYNIKRLDSLNIGCVSYQKRFFPTGHISKEAFDDAILNAQHQVDAIAKRFKKTGWKQAIGTSGTIKAIAHIINADSDIIHPITLKDVKNLKKKLLQFAHSNDISLPGLKENRRAVICSGVSVLIAVMKCLDIETIEYCQYALREGVLFEQLEDREHKNVRQRTIESLQTRFNIDEQQIDLVQSLALDIFKQVQEEWKLNKPIYQEMLIFAVQLHELGVDINPSGYQKHGQYIIEQADMAGFNQEQQFALAWLVGNQRKKITPLIKDNCYMLNATKLERLCAILRLSVLLSQQRYQINDFLNNVKANGQQLTLTLDPQWLEERPIIDTELFYEKEQLPKISTTLKLILAS